jgi:hypothetical protein
MSFKGFGVPHERKILNVKHELDRQMKQFKKMMKSPIVTASLLEPKSETTDK